MSATPETKFCGPRIGPRFGAVAPASTSVGIGAPPESGTGSWCGFTMLSTSLQGRIKRLRAGSVRRHARLLDHRHPLLDLGADELAQRRRRLAGLVGKLGTELEKALADGLVP